MVISHHYPVDSIYGLLHSRDKAGPGKDTLFFSLRFNQKIVIRGAHSVQPQQRVTLQINHRHVHPNLFSSHQIHLAAVNAACAAPPPHCPSEEKEFLFHVEL
jgi:hypothetical protein